MAQEGTIPIVLSQVFLVFLAPSIGVSMFRFVDCFEDILEREEV